MRRLVQLVVDYLAEILGAAGLAVVTWGIALYSPRTAVILSGVWLLLCALAASLRSPS